MITFKSKQDLAKLPSEDPAHPIVKELVDRLITEYTPLGGTYNHEDYGLSLIHISEPTRPSKSSRMPSSA